MGLTTFTTMAWDNLFADAVVDHPGVRLPDQGPWILSQSDLKLAPDLIIDLVKHDDPLFLYLWNLLSSETRKALEAERAKMGIPGVLYRLGPGLPGLTADLNKLIQGKLIYEEGAFATIKPYLSGDTRKLLSQPAGTNLARLNRLLLEEALPIYLQRRPKIMFDSYSTNYVFVDFVTKIVTIYGQDGGKNLTADLGPALAKLSESIPWYRDSGTPAGGKNVGIWDVVPEPGGLLVHVMGRAIYRISLSTGEVKALPHF